MGTRSAIAVNTSLSSSSNAHRLVQPGSGVLLLEPDFSLARPGLGILLLSPVIFLLIRHYSNDHQLLVWGTAAPWFAGVPLIIQSLIARAVGIRMRFDRDRGEIKITGVRFRGGVDYAINEVREIQFCSGGTRGGGHNGHWESFQLNLLVNRQGEISHVNVLDNGGERQLRDISRRIAEFLEVPFYDDTRKPPTPSSLE